MKLATLKDGSRDGQLVVVSRDLSTAHFTAGITGRMQSLLDDWNFLSPQLEDLYATLNDGKARHAFPFDPRQAMAPLPRTAQFVLATPAGAQQRAGDALLGPAEDPGLPGPLRARPALGALVGELALGAPAGAALDSLRLLLLLVEWTLPLAEDLQPAVNCAPVAVTPDELGAAWAGGRLRGRLRGPALAGARRGAAVDPDDPAEAAEPALAPGFGALLSRCAAVRRVRAGTLVAAPWAGLAPWEVAAEGRLQVAFEIAGGASVFGAIDLQLAAAAAAAAAAADAPGGRGHGAAAPTVPG